MDNFALKKGLRSNPGDGEKPDISDCHAFVELYAQINIFFGRTLFINTCNFVFPSFNACVDVNHAIHMIKSVFSFFYNIVIKSQTNPARFRISRYFLRGVASLTALVNEICTLSSSTTFLAISSATRISRLHNRAIS